MPGTLRHLKTTYIMNKKTWALCLFLIASVTSIAQQDSAPSGETENKSYTYGELKAGYGVTQFSSNLSERFENGNFSTSGGGLFSLAAYRKFKNINHLHFGFRYKGLAAGPAQGDNNEEMFFNFWGTAVSTKYFPFSKPASKGLYLQGDFNFVSQFTQKYRTTESLNFDHQFAIGNSIAFGLGYHLPLKKGSACVISVEYDSASRRGEVEGIGDVQFRNSNIALQIGIIY